MQLFPLFLRIFLLLSTGFSVSRALQCRLNSSDPSKVAYSLSVGMSGKGMHTKIQEAIDSVPSGNDQWIRIHVNPGIYMEKATIPKDKPCILLQGSGYSRTTIVWNEHDVTDKSATFTAFPDNFVAKYITFKNSYNRPLMPNNVSHASPAVAARIYGDKSAFYECAFLGFQDTLWDANGRHYFKSCYIEGAVDFIWGSGQSFYEDCSINATAGLLPPRVSAGYVTAQGRQSPGDPSGFVFKGGSVSGNGHVYLGRAYRPYSRVIFYGTTLSEIVIPEGWYAWHYQGHEENIMYAEVSCRGPGAETSRRVGWERKNLGDPEVQKFSRSSFIDQDEWVANLP